MPKADGTPTRKERSELNKATWAAASKAEKSVLTPRQAYRGRSLPWSFELFDKLCDLVSEGYTLRRACTEIDVSEKLVRFWVLENRGADPSAHPPIAGAHDLMKRALLLQSEAWADYLVDLAEEATEETVQLYKFRCEQHRWLMGKNNSRFNDKITIAGDANAPLEVKHGVNGGDLCEIIEALESAAHAKSRGNGGQSLLDQKSETSTINP